MPSGGGIHTIKLAVGRAPESGRALCSQPTMSRLENAPSRLEVARMTAALVDLFCRSFPTPPAAITLDIDDTCERTFGSNQLKQGRFFSCIRQPGNGFRNPPFPGCNRNREKMNGQNHPHRCPRQSAPAPQVRIRHTRQQAHRLRRPRPALGQQALLHPLPASRRARLEDRRGCQLHERRQGPASRRRDVDRDPAGRGCAS